MKEKNLNKKFVSVFAGLLAALFAVLLLVTIVCAYAFTYSYVEQDIYIAFSQMDEMLVNLLNEVPNLYARLIDDSNLASLIDPSMTGSERRSIFNSILENATVDTQLFDGLVLYLGEYSYTFGKTSTVSLDFIESLTNNYLRLYDVSKEGSIICGMRFQSYPSAIVTGGIVFFLSPEKLNDVCSYVGDVENGHTMLLADSGTIFASTNPKDAGKEIYEKDLFGHTNSIRYKSIDGQLCAVAIRDAQGTNSQYDWDLKFVSVIYVNVLLHDTIILIIILSIAGGIMLCISVYIAISFARQTVKPIKSLSTTITAVASTGEYNKTISADSKNELIQLEKAYDDMIMRLFALWEENKENMEIQRKLEMDALQAQINPHFLYNTLDAIAWMAKIKKQSEIEKLSINLAKFFRLCLHKGDKFVTVNEEVELVYRFLEIEKIRFPDKIELKVKIDEKIAHYTTLKLLLQPIVENSVKHGFADSNAKGIIEVNAYGDGDDIVFEVLDNGAGFDASSNLLSNFKDGNSQGGFGLKNVNERIKLEYGEKYGLFIHSQKGKGTKVTVKVAKRF